jgi:hypothetical protein
LPIVPAPDYVLRAAPTQELQTEARSAKHFRRACRRGRRKLVNRGFTH